MQERKIHTKSPTGGILPKQIVFLLHGYGADGADLIDLSSPFSMVLPYAKFILLMLLLIVRCHQWVKNGFL